MNEEQTKWIDERVAVLYEEGNSLRKEAEEMEKDKNMFHWVTERLELQKQIMKIDWQIIDLLSVENEILKKNMESPAEETVEEEAIAEETIPSSGPVLIKPFSAEPRKKRGRIVSELSDEELIEIYNLRNEEGRTYSEIRDKFNLKSDWVAQQAVKNGKLVIAKIKRKPKELKFKGRK